MNTPRLIDLHFPAASGTAEDVGRAAFEHGIDAVIYAANSIDELPEPDEIATIAAADDMAMIHPAVVVLGHGYRFSLLVTDWADSSIYDVLEALDNPRLIQATLAEHGGCALPICPRHAPDGEVIQILPSHLRESQVGTVTWVSNGSLLARHLDVEDTLSSDRRSLAGTGPFGSIGLLGQYATYLHVDHKDVATIIAALSEGKGHGVEISDETLEKPSQHRRHRRRRETRKSRSRSNAS